MTRQFISLDKAIRLEQSIGFLSNFTIDNTNKDIEYVIGNSLEDVDEKYTKLFQKLIKINTQRQKLLNKFKL